MIFFCPLFGLLRRVRSMRYRLKVKNSMTLSTMTSSTLYGGCPRLSTASFALLTCLRTVNLNFSLRTKSSLLEGEGELERADAHWRQATKAHKLHYDLWLEWAAFGERTSQDTSWWHDYHDALLRGLTDHEEPAWNILSKRVYPKLLDGMEGEDKRRLFIAWIKDLDVEPVALFSVVGHDGDGAEFFGCRVDD